MPFKRAFPIITLITVVKNGESYLAQTIESVVAQSYPNIDYIIIDGGSSDRTLTIVRKNEEHIAEWISEPDNGIYDAMNKGLSMAHGELIGFLNADDFLEPDAVENLVEEYRKRNIPGIYYGDTIIHQDDLGVVFPLRAAQNQYAGMGFCHPSCLVHREVFEKTGPFDLKYRIASDYDFVLKARSLSVPFFKVDKFIANYRNTGLTVRNYRLTMSENRRINSAYYGLVSFPHLIYCISYLRSMVLWSVEKAIGKIFGENFKKKYKAYFLKKALGTYPPKNVDSRGP